MPTEEEQRQSSGGYEQLERLRERTNLTRNQLGFWLIQQLDPSDTSCNMGSLYRIDGGLDPLVFNESFQAMLRSTDALRACFTTENGDPVQRFRETLSYEVEVVDLGSCRLDDDLIEQWCAERIARPLNIAERCFDTALLKLGDDRWAWYLCVHHVVIDGYSMNLVFDRVARAYRSTMESRSKSDEDHLRFEEFVDTERQYRQSQAATADGAYWGDRERTDGFENTFYGRRRETNRNRCTRKSFELTKSVSKSLLDQTLNVCGRTGNEQMTMLIAYLTIVSSFHLKAAESRVVTVGVPFHNRRSAAEHDTVGLLMEVVPLSIHVDAGDSFADHCSKWRRELLQSIRHYRYGSINPPRARRYDTMLNFVSAPSEDFNGRPVHTRWIHSGNWNESLTIQIQSDSSARSDRMYLDLNEEIFEAPYGDFAFSLIRSLTEAMAQGVDFPIGQAGDFTAAEETALQSNVDGPWPVIRDDDTIVRRFLGVVTANAERAAVIDGDRVTTYGELDTLSETVATRLDELGAKAGHSVGFSLPRSVEMIAAILGILKNGCTYVPIDHSYPTSRLAVMAEDAAVSLVISDADRGGAIAAVPGVTVENIADVINSDSHADFRVNGWRACSRDSCAYVNFTSGSTGRPKGVQVPHGGVIRLVSHPDYIDLTPETRMLMQSAVSFDAATFEIWGALLRGGTLVVHPDGVPSAASIRRLSEDHGANTVFLTTSVFNAIVDEDLSVFHAVDQLITGGEAASFRHFQAVRSRYPHLRFLNAYGPTECTTFTTCYEVPSAEQLKQPIPIGRTISNTYGFVLDEAMNEVPVGVVGTLYVGGPGVAIGYLRQPEKTASSFVTATKGRCRGLRLYNTGDRVRLMPSGDLVFVNRVDDQVKVKGIRIELSEVEGALKELPSVNQAIVLLHESKKRGKGLVAYVTLAEKEVSAADLRLEMLKLLPQNIVPRWIEILESFPIGVTGKLDRKNLPEPTVSRVRVDQIVRPRTDLDKDLLSIWSDVLDTDVDSIDQNFFDLGGDSISAIKIAARTTSDVHPIEAQEVFEAESIRSLADRIQELQDRRDKQSPIQQSTVSKISDQDISAVLAELDI
jgi:amino acid adenylation domain-containing protein